MTSIPLSHFLAVSIRIHQSTLHPHHILSLYFITMPRLNLNKPSHIMITWAALTVTGASVYIFTKNDIYLRRRVQAVPSETIPTRTELSWEERIAQDEENAAKKGYKVNYKDIRDSTATSSS